MPPKHRPLARLPLLAAVLGIGLVGPAVADEAPHVVASVAPIHSLVAAVMQGVGEPTLIVKSGASPHSYSLRPSDARSLQEADAVFWVGEGLETFLTGPLATLSPDARVVELAEAPGLVLLPVREGGAFEPHHHDDADEHDAAAADHDGHDHEADHAAGDHEHAGEAEQAETEHAEAEHHHDHAHEAADMHLWLDPRNARAMTSAIAAALAEVDPPHAAVYAANAAALDARLAALDERLATELAPVKAKPFITFHDAYQYLDRRYGLAAVGTITVDPGRAPGAERIAELRGKIERLEAVCVFAEPQFEAKVVASLVDGTDVRTGVLDPDAAAGHTPGPDLYFELMDDLGASLVRCLGGTA